jgi:acylphosphatase
MKAVRVYISGNVQGVFYRANTKEQAENLDIAGWVKNLPDGRVEAVFEGADHQVEKMVEWCWKGSPAAEVEAVKVEPVKVKDRNNFRIKR